ncbi:MAG: hypothetical protein HW421_1643 [Ignavibacteria bacterium]|nr:hypothetical protein [Ignavibacteria bacterium]
MTSELILQEILSLPFEEQIYIAEQTLKTMTKINPVQLSMLQASKELLNEYRNNKKLTEFSCLDAEEFYEAR